MFGVVIVDMSEQNCQGCNARKLAESADRSSSVRWGLESVSIAAFVALFLDRFVLNNGHARRRWASHNAEWAFESPLTMRAVLDLTRDLCLCQNTDKCLHSVVSPSRLFR